MRKGMGKGQGKGYKNMIGKDPVVHRMSAKGMKQPQKVSPMQELFGSADLSLFNKRTKQNAPSKKRYEVRDKFGLYSVWDTKENKIIANFKSGYDANELSKKLNRRRTVTKGKWCVSYLSGGDIPSGKVELHAYYFDKKGNLIKAPEYGMIVTKDEAKQIALDKGYLQFYDETRRY